MRAELQLEHLAMLSELQEEPGTGQTPLQQPPGSHSAPQPVLLPRAASPAHTLSYANDLGMQASVAFPSC